MYQSTERDETREQRHHELRWLRAVADGDALAMRILESIDPSIESRLAATYDLKLERIESVNDRQRRFRSLLAQHLAVVASEGARRAAS